MQLPEVLVKSDEIGSTRICGCKRCIWAFRSSKELLEKYGLTAEKIAEKAEKAMKRKKL